MPFFVPPAMLLDVFCVHSNIHSKAALFSTIPYDTGMCDCNADGGRLCIISLHVGLHDG